MKSSLSLLLMLAALLVGLAGCSASKQVTTASDTTFAVTAVATAKDSARSESGLHLVRDLSLELADVTIVIPPLDSLPRSGPAVIHAGSISLKSKDTVDASEESVSVSENTDSVAAAADSSYSHGSSSDVQPSPPVRFDTLFSLLVIAVAGFIIWQSRRL